LETQTNIITIKISERHETNLLSSTSLNIRRAICKMSYDYGNFVRFGLIKPFDSGGFC